MPQRHRSTRATAVACVVAVMVLWGACSDSDDGASARETLVSAPEKTFRAGSSRVAIEVETRGGERPGVVRGEGAFDFSGRRGRISFDLSPFGFGRGETIDLLVLPEVFYVETPPELGPLSARPWLRVDLRTLGEAAGAQLQGYRRLGNNDPTAAVDLLRGASGKVEEVGEERVRGTETTRFRTRLDLDAVRSKVPAAAADDVARVRDELGARYVPTEAWIDEDGRVRRFRYTVDLANARAEDLTGTLVTTFELFDFGTSVDVREPSAGEFTDLSTVATGQAAG